MDKYEQQPPVVDAMQFEGGSESAIQINNWLSSYGVIVVGDTIRDELLLREDPASDVVKTVKVSDWIVRDRDGVISVVSDEDFSHLYKKAPGPKTTEESSIIDEVS